VSEHFAGSGFAIFAKLLEQEGTQIRAIPAPGGGSRKFCDRMNAFAQKEGLPGMGYIFWREKQDSVLTDEALNIIETVADTDVGKQIVAESGGSVSSKTGRGLSPTDMQLLMIAVSRSDLGLSDDEKSAIWSKYMEAAGPLATNIGPERTEAIRQQLGLNVGDAAFFLGGKPSTFEAVAGRARVEIGTELKLTETDRFAFAWIVDFPMYEKDDEGKIDFSHNPFSMPQGGMEALSGDPLEVLGYQYDLACNGYELISGAIRNHRPEIMFRAFELAGYGEDEVRKRFGGMVDAFRFGAPPHGGCAAGIDRIVMLLADEANIRQVILFPMNQRAEDTMMNAPSDPTPEQLRDLRLRVVPPES